MQGVKTAQRFAAAMVALMAAMVLTAGSAFASSSPSKYVEVEGPSYMAIYDTQTATVTFGVDDKGNPIKKNAEVVSWESSDTDVATVDNEGNITAKKFGKVTISVNCSINGKEGYWNAIDIDVYTSFERSNSAYNHSKAWYKVLDENTVAYVKPSVKTYGYYTVPPTVIINGKKYTVVGINAKAFASAKKATKMILAINNSNLTKSGVKNSLKSSKIKTVQFKKSKYTSSQYKAKKGYFKKANSGKSVKTKRA